MKIFINDIPVNLIKATEKKIKGPYSLILDGREDKITAKKLIDDVLILNASAQKVEELLQLMTDKKLKNLDSITFASDDKKSMVAYIKRKFTIVKAGGGIVEKSGQTLLIYRLGRWDLPKGKLDKGESIKECALREVEEETGVRSELGHKVCHTWHTYTRNKKYVMKKTSWYAMKCIDDSNLQPQRDEGIDEARWMNLSEMREALYGSYRAIRFVIKEYHNQLKSASR